MTKRPRLSSAALDRAARRLLEALDEAGARALRGQIDESAIIVVAPRKNVTVVRASLPMAVAESVAAQGLARWEGEGETRRLLLTPEGRAALRRGAAPANVDPFRAQHSPLARLRIEEGAAPARWSMRARARSPGWRGARIVTAGHFWPPSRSRRASAFAAT
ncbi:MULTISPECIES: hypothetical protein [Methylosinus]|uniref:hypothetical protein n=1 Tax=Methylosinus TaxID=425 RepID=UPI0001D2D305|nr:MULTISPECIES: hypothetical protein [Methylosinus]